MATTISTQDIVDAKRDIDDIGKAVNENVIVSPRYGDDFKSLPMITAEAQGAIGEWEAAISLITQEGGVPALAVSDASGKNQQEFNNYIGRRWFNTPLSKGMKVLMPNGTPVISRIDNNTVDPSIDFANWMTEGNYVNPKMFGGVCRGNVADVDIDTAAMKKCIASGRIIKLYPADELYINEELEPPAGRPLVIISNKSVSGEVGATLRAAPGFTGYVLKPVSVYDIRNVRVIGNNLDGCYLIGNNIDGYSNFARLENFYFSDCDFGVHFGEKWEHPWGLYYSGHGTAFRTCGINLGGNSGAASSGESAFDINLVLTASVSGANGIPAPSQVVTQNVTATTDKIDWDNTSTPYFGWCVLRSANGTSDWHVPPNWTSSNHQSGTFTANKNSGETWYYQVVRMTIGCNIRRAKAINFNILQSEYFGIGLRLVDVNSCNIDQIYSETRNREIPLSNYTAVYLQNSRLTMAGGWVEAATYPVSVMNNSILNLSGTLTANNCYGGKYQIGGSTDQHISISGELVARGSTPNTYATTGGINDHNICEVFYNNSAMHHRVDGANGGGYHVHRRGVEQGSLVAGANGATLTANNAIINRSGDVITPAHFSQRMLSLSSGVEKSIIKVENIPSNAAGSIVFDALITVRDSSFNYRQSWAGRLTVQYVRPSGGSAVASVSAVGLVLNGTGTLSDPVFAIKNAAAGAFEIAATATTSIASPNINATALSNAQLGIDGRAVVITQLT